MLSTRRSCPIVIKLQFSPHIFEEVIRYQILLKSVLWEPSCSVRTNGHTDTKKLIVAFGNFAKAPEKCIWPLDSGPRSCCKHRDF